MSNPLIPAPGIEMLEEMRFGGTPRNERAIIVQTSKGTSLRNLVIPPIDHQHVGFYRALRRNHGANWRNRKPALGGYNCAGMVWANRRTAITEPDDWERILNEDGYRRLDRHETPFPGDVVIYRNAERCEITHVARIVNIERQKSGELAAIWALSKWNASSGEDYHRVQDVFCFGGEGFSTEFWTERTTDELETTQLVI